VPDCQRLAAHLTTDLPAIGFLFDFTLDHELESGAGAAFGRRQSQGVRWNRSRGAEAQEILSSIVQTARLRALDPRDVLVDLLRSPQPTVSPALARL
jgi:hypothetical protein